MPCSALYRAAGTAAGNHPPSSCSVVCAVSWHVLGFAQITGQAQFVTHETDEEALTVEATAATYSGNVVHAYMPGTATGNLLLIQNGATPLLHVWSIWFRYVAKLLSAMLL